MNRIKPAAFEELKANYQQTRQRQLEQQYHDIMSRFHVPIYDYRDPACPPDYDPEAEWDAYEAEMERRAECNREEC